MKRLLFSIPLSLLLLGACETPAQSEHPVEGAPVLSPGQTAPCPDCPVLVVPAGVPAVGESPGETIWTRPTLTGDWWGVRSHLKENGIRVGGSLTQFGFGAWGGVDRTPPVANFPLQANDGFEYTGRGDYELEFDLEKFGGLPKGKLLIRAQNWFGQFGNVSFHTGAFPPAVFPAALPPAPNDPGIPFLTDFFITQPFSKNFVVYAGKKNVIGGADQDDFAGGNGTVQFMNQAFIANPAFLLAMPYTSFTAGVVSPQEWGAISAYVYDPKNRTEDFFRFDDLFAEGIILGMEVKLKTNFFSLPGEHHVGGLWKHLNLSDLRFNEPVPGQYPYTAVPGFATKGDSYTIYYGFDQYFQVLSGEGNKKRGWGMFGRASISDGNPTPLRYFLSAGIGGYSPIGHERGDQFGIGFYYVGASTEFGRLPRLLFDPRDGWGMELYYNYQVTPWMSLSPDFQIIQPGARAIANTAYVGGLRLGLTF